MRIHSNAKTTPVSRAAMIARRSEGWTVGMIGAAYDVSDATVHKWLRRYAQVGSQYVTFHMPDAKEIEAILLLGETVVREVAQL